MKITRLRIAHFLGIEQLEINLNEGLNMVRGRNGSGKTSILEAIRTTLGGAAVDKSLIRNDGTGESETLVELDGSTIVRRRIDESGTKLSVTEKQGTINKEIKQGRRWLTEIVGAIGLDPIALFNANPAERRRILLSVVPPRLTESDVMAYIAFEIGAEIGDTKNNDRDALAASAMAANIIAALPFSLKEKQIGLAELGVIESEIMARRAHMWSEKDRAERSAQTIRAGLPPDYKPEDVPDVADVLRELEFANESQQMAIASRHTVDRCHESAAQRETALRNAERQLELARTEHEQALRDVERATADHKAKLAAAINPEPIRERLSGLETRRMNRHAYDQMTTHESAAVKYAAVVRGYDRAVRRAVRERLPELLWSRIDGSPLGDMKLSMVDGALKVNGVDIDNMSESERLRLAMAVARATAGELKTICVDGLESFDKTTLATFVKEAESDGHQYIAAHVDDCDLVIQ